MISSRTDEAVTSTLLDGMNARTSLFPSFTSGQFSGTSRKARGKREGIGRGAG